MYNDHMGRDWIDQLEPGNLKGIPRLFLWLLIRPPVIAFFALLLTCDYWMPAAVYLLLWTCLLGAGSLFVGVVAAAGVLGLVGGMGRYITRAVRRIAPLARAAQRTQKSGDIEAYTCSLEQWRAQMRAFSFRPLWLGMLSVLVIIPSIVAFVLSDGVPALKKEHGRLRYATQRERIQSTLHAFQRRGLF